MSDVYVDKAATGTGDGSSPTNAFVDVLSVTWSDGLRAWVRRTHTQTYTQSQFVGPNSFFNGFAKWSWLIGWPNSGDTMYNERPAAGQSAWDGDTTTSDASSTFGYNWPTLCGSNNGISNQAFLLGRGVTICNFYFTNCGASNAQLWSANDQPDITILDNVMPTFKNGPLFQMPEPAFNGNGIRQFGHLVMCSSGLGTSDSGMIHGSVYAQKVTIHSLTQGVGAVVFDCSSAFYCGHLVNWSSSLVNIFDGKGDGQFMAPFTQYVKRVSGVQPLSLALRPSGSIARPQIVYVDDYYGIGPAQFGSIYSYNFLAATSLEAMFNGSRSQKWLVSSGTGLVEYLWQKIKTANVSKQFSVTSGTQIAIRVPVYVDSTNTVSLASGFATAHLFAQGCNPQWAVQSNVLVGSPGLWTGSLISGGSAFFLEFKFTPKETLGAALFECQFPKLTQSSSGQAKSCYMLMSEPYGI